MLIACIGKSNISSKFKIINDNNHAASFKFD